MGCEPFLRPWELRRLTFAEVAHYLNDDPEKPTPEGGAPLTPDLGHAAAWRALTPAQRLARARER